MNNILTRREKSELEGERLKVEALILEKNFETAEKKINFLIKKFPDDEGLKILLSSLLTATENFKKAEEILLKTLINNEDLHIKYYYLCVNYLKSKNYKKFVDSFILSVKNKKDYKEVNSFFFNSLNSPFIENDYNYLNCDDIKHSLINVIELELLPIDAIRITIQKILIKDSKIDKEGIEYLKKLEVKIINSKKERISELIIENFSNSGKELLLSYISNDIVTNPYIEKLISLFRLGILKLYSEDSVVFEESEYLNNLLLSIYYQCTLNNYSLVTSDEEKKIIFELGVKLKNTSDGSRNYNISDFLIYGAYMPLDQSEYIKNSLIKKIKKSKKKLDRLGTRLNRDKEYQKYKKNINTNFPIENKNLIVKQEFYNENSGPEWGKILTDDKIPFLDYLKIDLTPFQLLAIPKIINKPNILYVGCGSGRDTMKISNIENCHVDALDISINNLSYFEKKCREHKVKNINIYLMDFIDVKKLNKKYDVIFINGVFNATDDLENNFKILSEILNDDGFIKLSMESPIIEDQKSLLREELKIHDIDENSSIESIKNFIFASNQPAFKSLLNDSRFYDRKSMYKLLFNNRKILKSLLEMKDIFKKESFDFLGFGNFVNSIDNKLSLMALYSQNYKDDIFLKNLDNWHEFEKATKIIFKNNYKFWLKKAKKRD